MLEEGTPKLYLFPIDSITDTAIRLPGDPSDDPVMQKDCMIIKNRSEWYSVFQREIAIKLSEN